MQKPLPPPETISILEAARRLNVSERTVYRMMKSGILTRKYEYDSVRLMSEEVSRLMALRRIESDILVSEDVSQVVRPIAMERSSADHDSLRLQLMEKDAQIAQLLSRQREMGVMVERLQEHLHELTR